MGFGPAHKGKGAGKGPGGKNAWVGGKGWPTWNPWDHSPTTSQAQRQVEKLQGELLELKGIVKKSNQQQQQRTHPEWRVSGGETGA